MSGNGNKVGGGTRNYSKAPSTKAARQAEFNRQMATGEYDPDRSHFDKSGGYVLTHNHHNLPNGNDKEQFAADALAAKGYKVTLSDERSTVSGGKTPDGELYNQVMDIKTIHEPGTNTIKSRLEKATKQGATTAVLVQGTSAMSKEYVNAQIKHFQENSPARARAKLQYVIVVGMSGSVHRHKLK